MTTLGPLAVLLLLCVPGSAKQPAPEEIGPPLVRCEVRVIDTQRYIRVPYYVTKDSWAFPGGWYYVPPNMGTEGYFKRYAWGAWSKSNVYEDEFLTLDELARVGGLPW